MGAQKSETEIKRVLAAHRAHKRRGTLRPEILKMYKDNGLEHLLDERAKPNKTSKQVARAQEVIDFFKAEAKPRAKTNKARGKMSEAEE